MIRLPLLISIFALMLIGIVASGVGTTTAQDDTSTVDGDDLVGSWQVVVAVADGRSFLTLSTYNADGTVLSSGSPVLQPPPGSPPGLIFQSAAHGAWEATGPDTANVTFVHVRSSAEGLPLGTLTVRTAATLGVDGQSFSGEFVSTLADPAGATLATFAGTVQGTRIVAEAPEMPEAGTPTS